MERGNIQGINKRGIHCFAEGMLTSMKQDFKFFNIADGEYIESMDVTGTTVVSDYQPATEAK